MPKRSEGKVPVYSLEKCSDLLALDPVGCERLFRISQGDKRVGVRRNVVNEGRPGVAWTPARRAAYDNRKAMAAKAYSIAIRIGRERKFPEKVKQMIYIQIAIMLYCSWTPIHWIKEPHPKSCSACVRTLP